MEFTSSRLMELVSARRGKDFEKMETELLDGVTVNDYVGGGKPEGIAKNWLDIFLAADFIYPEGKYFDFGSGCGRLAPLFQEVLTTGSYLGGDIVSGLVDFCNSNLKLDKCNFVLLEGENPLYPDEQSLADRKSMASLSGEFDRIFALSVFTHFDCKMSEDYFQSLANKLSEGGMMLISAFVLTEFSRENIRSGYSNRTFNLDGDTLEDNGPLSAVAYELSFFCELALSCGLYLESFLVGNWSGFVGRTYQDVLVFRKPIHMPSGFDPVKYLAANRDVSESNHNPYHHYYHYGRFEDRKLK